MIHLLYITIYEKQNQDNIDVNIFSPSTIKINLVLIYLSVSRHTMIGQE